MRRWLPGAVRRLLRSEAQAEEDVRAELKFHLSGRAEELEARGVPAAEARRRAEREFGDVSRIEAETRRVARSHVRRLRWRDGAERVSGDVRFALRTLRRSPLFTVMALATLALGIGATTAVFTVVDAVLLRPLPYPESDRLVVVRESNPLAGEPGGQTSPPNYRDFRAGSAGTFEGLAAFEYESPVLTGVEDPAALEALGVTGDFFDIVGVPAAVGRTPRPDDPAGVAVLSHGFWLHRFGGAPDVVGRAIRLDGRPVEVVGVMPPGFAVPTETMDLWLTTGIAERAGQPRSSRYLEMLGRLRPGVAPAAAEAELDAVAARLGAEYPASNEGWSTRVVPAREELVGEARGVLLVLAGAVGLLLVLATVNVSNLLLGRVSARRGEIAVRAALGASAGRLRAQLAIESAVLAVAAGVGGIAVAYLGVDLLLRLEAAAIPRAAEVAVDPRVLAFALAISLVSSFALGLAPALRAGRMAPAAAMRKSGRGGGGAGGGERRDALRRGLIGVELVLSLVLLVAAGLLFRSVLALGSVDPGYATEHVVAAQVNLDQAAYPDRASRVTYFETLLDRVSALPEVAAAGITTTLPLTRTGIDFNLPYRREGEPSRPEPELPEVDYRIISAGYPSAMGIPLLRGRQLTTADRAETGRVVLINQAFAETLWPGEDPIGRRVIIHYIADDGLDWEVVGVLGDTRHAGIATPAAPQVFVPMTQAEWLFDYMSLVVRTHGPAPGLVPRLRAAALAVDPGEPLFDVQSMASLRAGDVARERLALRLLGLFAGLALLLAATGVYAVVAYQVTRRTAEIGVRVALGARRVDVLRTVMGEVAATAGVSLAIGLLAALTTTRLLDGLLFGVRPIDPATLGAATGILFAATMIAAWVPARRAAGQDPVRALRAE